MRYITIHLCSFWLICDLFTLCDPPRWTPLKLAISHNPCALIMEPWLQIWKQKNPFNFSVAYSKICDLNQKTIQLGERCKRWSHNFVVIWIHCSIVCIEIISDAKSICIAFSSIVGHQSNQGIDLSSHKTEFCNNIIWLPLLLIWCYLHTFEFFTSGISVRLSDRFKVTQNKINFFKTCPQWGLNSQPPDHDSNALTTELGRNLLGRRFLKWALFHAPLYMLDFVHF